MNTHQGSRKEHKLDTKRQIDEIQLDILADVIVDTEGASARSKQLDHFNDTCELTNSQFCYLLDIVEGGEKVSYQQWNENQVDRYTTKTVEWTMPNKKQVGVMWMLLVLINFTGIIGLIKSMKQEDNWNDRWVNYQKFSVKIHLPLAILAFILVTVLDDSAVEKIAYKVGYKLDQAGAFETELERTVAEAA